MSSSLKKTLTTEFLNVKTIITIILISIIYYSFSVLLLSEGLVTTTLLGNYPLTYKYNLLSALVLGSQQSLGNTNLILMILTSSLVGVNLVTVFKNLKKLKKMGGKLTLSASGTAIIGIFVAGCSTCGFSVFALLGLTAAVTVFPFEGTLIGLIIIAILIVSTIYSINTLHREVYCKLDNSSNKEDK